MNEFELSALITITIIIYGHPNAWDLLYSYRSYTNQRLDATIITKVITLSLYPYLIGTRSSIITGKYLYGNTLT